METSAKTSPCIGDLEKLAEIEYEHHPGIYNHWITVIYSFVLFFGIIYCSSPDLSCSHLLSDCQGLCNMFLRKEQKKTELTKKYVTLA